MTAPNKVKASGIPLLVIAIGVGWLLNALGVIPDVNWVWTGGLAAVGAVLLLTDGLNKVSIVLGPLFITASVLSLLRQTGRIPMNVEVPWLVISFGVLLLISHWSTLPIPSWIIEEKKDT